MPVANRSLDRDPSIPDGLKLVSLGDGVVRCDRTFTTYGQYRGQYLFHRLAARFKGLSGPVGTGKTVAISREAVKLAYLNSGTVGLLAAPTYPMLRDILLRTTVEILEDERIPYRRNLAEMWLYLEEPDSYILLRSMDDPERLRGRNLSFFGCDELSYCKEASWLRLEARLREPKARHLCGFGGWTPKGKDWVYRRFIHQKTRLPMHDVVFARPGENKAVLDRNPQYYEVLKRSYDDRFYRQEALGEYLDVFGGAVYHAFDPDRHVAALRFDPRYPICLSCDFNVSPMCWVIAQVIPFNRERSEVKIHVLDEITLPGATTRDACEEFFHRFANKAGWARLQVDVYGDPSGKSRSTASSETDWQIIESLFARRPEFDARFHVPDAHPLIKDRVNCVNALLKNAAGQVRLQVDQKCVELIRDLEDVKWKTDKDGNTLMQLDKSDYKRTHMSDAVGYLCMVVSGVWGQAALRREYVF